MTLHPLKLLQTTHLGSQVLLLLCFSRFPENIKENTVNPKQAGMAHLVACWLSDLAFLVQTPPGAN